MHRMTKLSASVVMGLALAAAPAWVVAQEKQEKKSTTEAAKTTVSDSWITAKTKIALLADSRVPSTSVNVETQKGMVYLRGKVDTAAAKSAAEEVTRGIEGVQAVRNELQVVPESAKKMVEAKDEEITKQVKAKLNADAKLKSLDVRSDNGVVTLQGKLPSITDSVRASQMAREVPGVRAVRNDTTYEAPRASMDADRTVARKDGSMTKDRDRNADMQSSPREQAHVRAAQEKLKEKGYDPGPIDGIWGPRTAAAVGEFQRKENLTVTSRLDSNTLGKLEVGVGGASPRKPQSP
jgi:osmotically-inducible protein OsmY